MRCSFLAAMIVVVCVCVCVCVSAYMSTNVAVMLLYEVCSVCVSVV